MNREKLLTEIKKCFIREFKLDSNKLKEVVPYYILIKNENYPILLDLITETNNHKFYISYKRDEENWYSHGTMSIRFGMNENQACGIEEKDEDFPDRYLQKDETYFEIDLTWYSNGSTDEDIPRIVIRKCLESEYIHCYENTSEEYNKWYSELTELQLNDKKNKLKQIDEQIKSLMKQKEQLK